MGLEKLRKVTRPGVITYQTRTPLLFHRYEFDDAPGSTVSWLIDRYIDQWIDGLC